MSLPEWAAGQNIFETFAQYYGSTTPTTKNALVNSHSSWFPLT
jgi:hypothetical protein